MLYNLQNFQLGSFDDVYSVAICERVLFKKPFVNGNCSVACLGNIGYDLSGTLLGVFQ